MPPADRDPVKLHDGATCTYHIVYFEDRAQWFIRCDDTRSRNQCWSREGWDRQSEARQAFFNNVVTYIVEAPGKS